MMKFLYVLGILALVLLAAVVTACCIMYFTKYMDLEARVDYIGMQEDYNERDIARMKKRLRDLDKSNEVDDDNLHG
jgi:hypothetical protein